MNKEKLDKVSAIAELYKGMMSDVSNSLHNDMWVDEVAEDFFVVVTLFPTIRLETTVKVDELGNTIEVTEKRIERETLEEIEDGLLELLDADRLSTAAMERLESMPEYANLSMDRKGEIAVKVSRMILGVQGE